MLQRQRTPRTVGNKNGLNLGSADIARRAGTKRKVNPASFMQSTFIVPLILIFVVLQLLFNSVMHGGSGHANHLRQEQSDAFPMQPINSYDVLLKNTISYEKLTTESNYENADSNANANANVSVAALAKLQEQIHNLQSQITTLESKSQKYADDPRFFPFVIRDSRHLTPIQLDPDFHVFDYVDLTQAKQPTSMHHQLLHNARVVVDEVLEAKRANETLQKKKKKKYAEKNEAPCQKYSIECYAQKLLQVFSYVLRKFPSVEYYFYVEADNDLCVPMTMVRDLALNEKRYFINTGIGMSGWIMSREFLADFIELYTNATNITVKQKSVIHVNGTIIASPPGPEIRPDVLASYYLTDKMAWTVTRQYWVSHTTLESLGTPSLTVKDRRNDVAGDRMKLDKHLPRCLEPRRGKWKVMRRRPYLDPRDRFGWDYFDYDVCPNEILFPCGGPDQLKQLVADDWRVANETGALDMWKRIEERQKRKAAALKHREKLEARDQKLVEEHEKARKEGEDRMAKAKLLQLNHDGIHAPHEHERKHGHEDIHSHRRG